MQLKGTIGYNQALTEFFLPSTSRHHGRLFGSVALWSGLPNLVEPLHDYMVALRNRALSQTRFRIGGRLIGVLLSVDASI